MAELPGAREPGYSPNRPSPAEGGFRAAMENAMAGGGIASTAAGTQTGLPSTATPVATGGVPRVIGHVGAGSASDWMLGPGATARRRQAASSTGNGGPGDPALAFMGMTDALASYSRQVDALRGEVARLAERCDRQADSISEARATADEARKAASGMARLADWAFWAVVLLGGGSAVLLVILVAHALFPAVVSEWVPRVAGFVGLAGALAVLVYLRKLGKLNERVERLEQRQDASSEDGFAGR